MNCKKCNTPVSEYGNDCTRDELCPDCFIEAQAAEIAVYKKALTEIKSIGHHLPLIFRSNGTDTISMIVSKALAAPPQKDESDDNN